MFLEPAEWSSEADSSKKHGEAIWHVVFQIARTYWRSVAYRHSRASRIVASLLRRNFTHTCVIFCQHLCVNFFILWCLSNIFVKCVFHKSLTKSSTKCRSVIRSSLAQSLPQSLPQSLLRSVDRVFDQFVINVSVKSLNRSSTKISLRSCQEIFVPNFANTFATFWQKHRHTLIFLKKSKSSISCSRGRPTPKFRSV